MPMNMKSSRRRRRRRIDLDLPKRILTASLTATLMILLFSLFSWSSNAQAERLHLKKVTVDEERQFVFEYNEEGLLIQKVLYGNDPYGDGITPQQKYTYDYFHGKLISKVSAYHGMGMNGDTSWTSNRTTEITYNDHGMKSMETRSAFMEGSWTPMQRISYRYDNQDRVTDKVVEQYNDGQWNPYLTTRISYADHNGKDLILPWLEEEDGENPFGFREGMATTAKRYSWDENAGDWKLREVVEFSWE